MAVKKKETIDRAEDKRKGKARSSLSLPPSSSSVINCLSIRWSKLIKGIIRILLAPPDVRTGITLDGKESMPALASFLFRSY